MDQLICASLSQTNYWYEVGMLKVPANKAYCFFSYTSIKSFVWKKFLKIDSDCAGPRRTPRRVQGATARRCGYNPKRVESNSSATACTFDQHCYAAMASIIGCTYAVLLLSVLEWHRPRTENIYF